MKKFLFIVVVVCRLVGLGESAHAAQPPINQADINRLNAVSEKVEQFIKDFNDQNVSATTLASSSMQLSVALDDVVKSNFNNKVGAEYDKASRGVQESAGKLKMVIDTLQSILAAKDEVRYRQFLKDFNAAHKDYQDKAAAWNDAVTTVNQSQANPYLWILIATGAFAVVAWAWALVKRDVRAVVQQAKKQVAIASLLPPAAPIT